MSNEDTIFTSMLDLAKSAPRVTVDELVDDRREHQQFGNNFYLLFMANKSKGGPKNISYSQWIDEQGTRWTAFVKENDQLLKQINTALKNEEIYITLKEYGYQLAKDKRFDEAEKFNKSIDQDLGFEAVGIAVWNELNPLLELAGQMMEEEGLNPKQFYG